MVFHLGPQEGAAESTAPGFTPLRAVVAGPGAHKESGRVGTTVSIPSGSRYLIIKELGLKDYDYTMAFGV